MSLTPSLTSSPIPTRGESNKPNIVLHGISNQQMGNKLQRGGSNPRPLAKPGSDAMLNDQLSYKLKLVGFGFNMNIMPLTTMMGFIAALPSEYDSIKSQILSNPEISSF